jgi:hypothetical protein
MIKRLALFSLMPMLLPILAMADCNIGEGGVQPRAAQNPQAEYHLVRDPHDPKTLILVDDCRWKFRTDPKSGYNSRCDDPVEKFKRDPKSGSPFGSFR